MRAEQAAEPPCPTAGDAAQDMLALGCKSTFMAHVKLPIHQHPQVFLLRAALNLSIPQPAWIPGLAWTQVPDLALVIGEPRAALGSNILRHCAALTSKLLGTQQETFHCLMTCTGLLLGQPG